MSFIAIPIQVAAAYLLPEDLARLKTEVMDRIIDDRCGTTGVLLEISMPHGAFPDARRIIQELFIEDATYAGVMERYSFDIRLNDLHGIHRSERICFGLKASAGPS